MASPVIIAIVLCLGTLSAAVPSRIVGGEETSIEQYPSVVQVEFRGIIISSWSQSCAGNILTSRWILSAAHCFTGFLYQPSQRRIRAGSSARNEGGVIHNVLRSILHPSYGTSPDLNLRYDGDIAVVELETALVFTPEIAIATIVAPGFTPPAGLPVTQAGWGISDTEGAESSTVLRDLDTVTVDHALCAARHADAFPIGYTVTDNMICTGIVDVGGKSACQGDGGGPLYYQDILIGIVSWDRGCADAHYPEVNTAVSPYTEWIIATAQ